MRGVFGGAVAGDAAQHWCEEGSEAGGLWWWPEQGSGVVEAIDDGQKPASTKSIAVAAMSYSGTRLRTATLTDPSDAPDGQKSRRSVGRPVSGEAQVTPANERVLEEVGVITSGKIAAIVAAPAFLAGEGRPGYQGSNLQ